MLKTHGLVHLCQRAKSHWRLLQTGPIFCSAKSMKAAIPWKYLVWHLFSDFQLAVPHARAARYPQHPGAVAAAGENWNKLSRSGRAEQLHSFQPKPSHNSLGRAGTSQVPTSRDFIGTYLPVSNRRILPLGTLAAMQLVY